MRNELTAYAISKSQTMYIIECKREPSNTPIGMVIGAVVETFTLFRGGPNSFMEQLSQHDDIEDCIAVAMYWINGENGLTSAFAEGKFKECQLIGD